MNRRAFIYNLGLGLAAGWAAGYLSWPRRVEASTPTISLALLADAHLRDGDPGRAEARALARAVAEIKGLKPPPRLVLFAGDLAHDGNPPALALGAEILSDLPMPVLAVRGEGDGRPEKGEAGWDLFGAGRFVYDCEGINLLGLDTAWQHTPEGPAFALREAQRRWLDQVLSGLDPAKPLVILSHAPLTPIFRPWGQWTLDSGLLLSQLSQFRKVLCLHGHVHHGSSAGESLEAGSFGPYRNPKPETRNPVSHLALPATSWPFPQALAGTPRKLRPGLGPLGCGWALVDLGPSPRLHQMAWQV
jgi:3',5'-cyclic-AMP phosphodiesterase